jgi:hypothetical protein
MIAELNDKITGLETEVARLNGETRNLLHSIQPERRKTAVEENLSTTKRKKTGKHGCCSTFSASNIK